MTTQWQEQQPDQRDIRGRQRGKISRRSLVIITVLILAVVIILTWILSYLSVIPSFWASIFTIIITVLGAVFAFFQSMHLFIPTERDELSESLKQRNRNFNFPLAPAPASQIPPIIVQLPTNQSSSLQLLPSDKTPHRGIVGLPPPTDPRTIQQRKHVVEEVYTKLTQPNITAIALTGIGGVGKSTLAALIYRYVEEQRQASADPFQAETLWLTIDPAVTFVDLAGNLFEALDRPLPDLGNLAPQNQAVALFNALKSTDKPRLIILDQFENLLDWDTGHALTDRPGVGEWLDIINSQPCACRILLTSRPRPVGTREYPPTYLHEYAIGGLEMHEGIALLQSQGIKGTEIELQSAVIRCDGHAFALTLLAMLMRDHHLDLPTLFKNSSLWSGNIATNILDQIYTQKLNDAQRELLLAFSVYREPVSIEAALAIITNTPRTQIPLALQALVTQHLVEAVGEGRYQLHAIISDYALSHFDESNEEANEAALRLAHTRAAQYYVQRATKTCPSREQRREINDVHDLIEAIWQWCQAERWQDAYNLIEQERIYPDLERWGGGAILLELFALLLPLEKWNPSRLQEARIYNNLGWMGIHDRLVQNEEVLKFFEKALDLSREAGDHFVEGSALTGLGWFFWRKEYFEQALSIGKEVGNRRVESMALNGLGAVYNALGNENEALECYEQALKIYKELGECSGVGRVLNNMGRVYEALGKAEEALECFQQAVNMHREVVPRGGEGVALTNLGGIYSDLGKAAEALKCYQQALSIFEDIGYRGWESWALTHLGITLCELSRRREAMECYRRALNKHRDIGNRHGEGITLFHIGNWYLKSGLYDLALASYLLARVVLKEQQGKYYSETQRSIDAVHNIIGDEQFNMLLAQVELQAQQIVEQALGESKQFTG